MRAVFLLCVLSAAQLHAHGVRLSASYDGNRLVGRAYSGSQGIANVDVTLTSVDGASIGTVTTDSEGDFSKTLDKPVSLKLSITLPDGHRASYDLDLEHTPPIPHDHDHHADHDHPPAKPQSDGSAAEIARLRHELKAMQSQRRLRDVLGGIGIIFGIAGVVALAKSRSTTRS